MWSGRPEPFLREAPPSGLLPSASSCVCREALPTEQVRKPERQRCLAGTQVACMCVRAWCRGTVTCYSAFFTQERVGNGLRSKDCQSSVLVLAQFVSTKHILIYFPKGKNCQGVKAICTVGQIVKKHFKNVLLSDSFIFVLYYTWWEWGWLCFLSVMGQTGADEWTWGPPLSKEPFLGSSRNVCAQSCPTLWSCGLQPIILLYLWDFPDKNPGVGCHILLQGIFLTLGLNPCLLGLLNCRWILYPWATRKATACMNLCEFGHLGFVFK